MLINTVIYFKFCRYEFSREPNFLPFRVKIIFKVDFFGPQFLSRRNNCHHPSRLVITVMQGRR